VATPLLVDDIVIVQYATYVPTHAQLGINRLVYQVVTAGSAEYETLAPELGNRIQNSYASWLPSIAFFKGCSVSRTKLNATGIDVGAWGPGYYRANIAGLNGATLAPLQASALVRWPAKGLNQTPPTVGRNYIPFVSLASYDGATGALNGLGSTRLLNLATFMGPEIKTAKGATLKMVIKRTNRPDPDEPPVLLGYSEVYGRVAVSAIATQRRRGDFGRVNAAFGGVI